jgi:hypothetical protein
VINLREAIAIHVASLPRTWPERAVDENLRVWFRGFIAACMVLDEHYTFDSLTPEQLAELARESLQLLNDGRLDYGGDCIGEHPETA